MTRRTRRGRALAGGAVAGLLVLAGCWQDQGSPPGGILFNANDVNAAGTVLAYAGGTDGQTSWVREPGGTWTSVGTLGAEHPVDPVALADDGTAIGNTFGSTPVPWIWEPATGLRPLSEITDLPHDYV